MSLQRRKELLLDALVARKNKVLNGQTPFAIFVKKLQESLTRMESFDVVTVTPGSDGRLISNPASMTDLQKIQSEVRLLYWPANFVCG